MKKAPPRSATTERQNPRSRNIDQKSTREILQVINREDAQVAGIVAREIPRIARAVDGIAARMRKGGRLFYIGAGTSGRLGVLDASECPPTFGVPRSRVHDWFDDESRQCDFASGSRDHRAGNRTGGDCRVHTDESGDGRKGGPKHAFNNRDDSAWPRLRQLDDQGREDE